MRSIKESFKDTVKLSEMINGNRVDEGFKDFFKMVKDKFKQAYQYLKGIVIKSGSYFLPVDNDGDVMPAITPLTAGQAYKDGYINKNSTCVVLDKPGSKLVGLNTKPEDAKKLYGSGDSRTYWKWRAKMVKECEESGEDMINEVRIANQDPEARYNVVGDDALLRKHVKMCIKNPNLARLMILGAPGIGKTAILNQVIDEISSELNTDYRLIVKTLSNETPDNFTLPKYIDVEGQSMVVDIPKTWLPVYKPSGDPTKDKELDEKCGKGLLFIDELSRATPQVLNVVLPLVNEGVFNEYKLGSGWTIVCASNRDEDELAGQTEIGNALSNRFKHFYYEPTVHTWKKWAETQGYMSPLLLQWLSMPESENMSGGKFFYWDPNDDRDDGKVTKLMCTPRSWTNAMRELAGYAHTGTLEGFTIFDIDIDILKLTLNAYVPASAVDSFVAFLDVVRKIGDFDRAVYDIWNNGGASFKLDKKDLNKIMLPLAQLIVCAHNNDLPTAEEFENLAKWLVKQNSDQLASYVLDAFKEVFMGMLSSTKSRDIIFVIQAMVKSGKIKQNEIAAHSSALKPFTTRWNIDFEEIPDYLEGQKILAKKYGESFMSAKIDGKFALG